MSLINQMLKDLESRREPGLAGQSSSLAGLTYAERQEKPRHLKRTLILLMAVVTTTAAALYFGLPLLQQQAAEPMADPQPITETIQPGQLAGTDVGTDVGTDAGTVMSNTAAEHGAEPLIPPSVTPSPTPVTQSTKPTLATSAAPPSVPVTQPVTQPVIKRESTARRERPRPTAIPQAPKRAVTITKRPAKPEEMAENAYRDALIQLRRGQRQRAESQLKLAIRTQAAHHKARETLSALYIRHGRMVEASTLLLDGMRNHPNHLPFIEQYARILAQNGDTPQAITLLEGSLAQATTRPAYGSLLAAFYQRQGQHTQSAALYKQLASQQPAHGNHWLGLGISLDALGEQPLAQEAFIRAQKSGTLSANSLSYIKQRLATMTPLTQAKQP